MYFIVHLWAIVSVYYWFCDLHCWMHKTVHIFSNLLLSYFLREGHVCWRDWSGNKTLLLFYAVYKGNLSCASLQLPLEALLWSEITIPLFIESFVQGLLRTVIPHSVHWLLVYAWLAGLLERWEKLVCQAILAIIAWKFTVTMESPRKKKGIKAIILLTNSKYCTNIK